MGALITLCSLLKGNYHAWTCTGVNAHLVIWALIELLAKMREGEFVHQGALISTVCIANKLACAAPGKTCYDDERHPLISNQQKIAVKRAVVSGYV